MAKAKKLDAIVTRDTVKAALANPNPAYVAAYVARAVLAIYQYQTPQEQGDGVTVEDNGVGFGGPDAFLGKITAEGYVKYSKPLPKFVDAWCKIGKNGYPRLAKYHAQLNKIALAKKESK